MLYRKYPTALKVADHKSVNAKERTMLSSDDTTQTTGAIERISRPYNHRDYAYERRQHILQQKQTEDLPNLESQVTRGKIAWRQFIQLREENKRLRWEIARYADEIETLQDARQQEVAQYASHVDTITADLNRTLQDHIELERRYQQLYDSFQSAVEDEAATLFAQTTRTLELYPENGAGVKNDAMKTVELHLKQIEEKHTAESLYLLRQTQKKAYQLEQELAEEQQQIALERDTMQNMQKSLREQTELRTRMVKEQLRAQFVMTIILIATILVGLVFVFQLLFLSWLSIPLTQLLIAALIVPNILCIVIVGLFAYVRSTTRSLFAIAPPKSADHKPS